MCRILSLSVTGIVRKMAGASMLPFSPPGLACPVSVCSVDVSYLFVFLVLLTFFWQTNYLKIYCVDLCRVG